MSLRNQRSWAGWSTTVLNLLLISTFAGRALACPFCGAINATFTEEIDLADLAVTAKLVKLPVEPEKTAIETQNLNPPRATFEVLHVIKGGGVIQAGMEIEAIYFGDGPLGKKFLLYGALQPKQEWSTPITLTDELEKYLFDVLKYPKDRGERAVLLQKHLLSGDPIVRQDAYNEFAITDYKDLQAVKSKFDLAQIRSGVANIESEESQLALNYTLLGLCGDLGDVPLLEQRMTSADDRQRKRLDALSGAYLTLRGESGLAFLDEKLIRPGLQGDKFTELYRVLLALRYHGDDGGQISREKIIPIVRQWLKYPKYADLVIPDLARWQDWDSMDQIMALYKDENGEAPFVREPAVKFMEVCPHPQAKVNLLEMERIDPDAFKRAKLFRAIPGLGAKKTEGATAPVKGASPPATPSSDPPPGDSAIKANSPTSSDTPSAAEFRTK
ncbi:MAG: hypothetical protein SFX18_02065 [Pirellulales bacterium]|nr:hypothetical protein [Pirellulales bacterium]